jgi:hypothetical protein
MMSQGTTTINSIKDLYDLRNDLLVQINRLITKYNRCMKASIPLKPVFNVPQISSTSFTSHSMATSYSTIKEVVDGLEQELEQWKNVVKRCPKPSLGSRLLQSFSRNTVAPAGGKKAKGQKKK